MSFVWHAVALVLLAELILLSAFVLPFPWGVRKNIARTIMRPPIRKAIDTLLRYVGFGLVLAILESVNSLKRLDERHRELMVLAADEASGLGEKRLSLYEFKYRRSHGQRNLYLSSFCLVLALVLARLTDLACKEMRLRDRIRALNGGKPIDQNGDDLADDRKSR